MSTNDDFARDRSRIDVKYLSKLAVITTPDTYNAIFEEWVQAIEQLRAEYGEDE